MFISIIIPLSAISDPACDATSSYVNKSNKLWLEVIAEEDVGLKLLRVVSFKAVLFLFVVALNRQLERTVVWEPWQTI